MSAESSVGWRWGVVGLDAIERRMEQLERKLLGIADEKAALQRGWDSLVMQERLSVSEYNQLVTRYNAVTRGADET